MERFTGITFIIPCGGGKLDHAAPAAELYTGSMFRHTLDCARRSAADHEAGGFGPVRILILSGLHGLVELGTVVEPYNMRMGDPGSVTAEQVRVQAVRLGFGWGDGDEDADRPGEVYTLLPKAYLRVLDEALRELYVYAQDVYEGCGGNGEQRRVNAIIGRPTVAPVDELPAGDGPTLWIGADAPALWTWTGGILVSYGRLRRSKTLPIAAGPWVCDSRGFNEIMEHGTWTITVEEYAADLNRYADQVGRLVWAAPQDWPAGAAALARTGLSEHEHQVRTIDAYEALVKLTGVHIIPVITGTTLAGYLRHLAMWQARGYDLTVMDTVVGVGALVKRAPAEAADIIRALHAAGVRRMHGFGLKGAVLELVGPLLESFDSAAWSDSVRREAEEAGELGLCPHGQGIRYERNCPEAARTWAAQQLALVGRAQVQEMLPIG